MRYDFGCKMCEHIQELILPLSEYKEDLTLFCSDCKFMTKHTLIVRAPAVENWSCGGSGRYFENLSPKGETFYSKGAYRKYLKERGIVEWSPKRGMPGCDP